MNLWGTRKVDTTNVKTRPLSSKLEVKANGADHKEDADEIELTAEEELDNLKNAYKSIEEKLKMLTAQIHERDLELKRLREITDKNTEFMQNIIMELINKPAPKSVAETYAERKYGLGNSAGARAVDNALSGPKGKLP